MGIGVSSVCFSSQSPSHKSKRQQQELIAELRRRQVKDNRHVYEGKDGAIEDIITGKGYFVFVVCSDYTAHISRATNKDCSSFCSQLASSLVGLTRFRCKLEFDIHFCPTL